MLTKQDKSPAKEKSNGIATESSPVLSKVSGDNPEDVFVQSVGSIIVKEKANNGYELERPQGPEQ